jgi:hypothetical protein
MPTNQPKRSTADSNQAKRSGSAINSFARNVLLVAQESIKESPIYILSETSDYILVGEAAISNQVKR